MIIITITMTVMLNANHNDINDYNTKGKIDTKNNDSNDDDDDDNNNNSNNNNNNNNNNNSKRI